MNADRSTPSAMLPILREEIRAAGGRITFARYMELCLYHPLHGYYNTERTRLGKHGDFYTNMHLGPVYARILARHFAGLWESLGRPARFDLVEMGPGDGQFARELLPWIRKRFPESAEALRCIAVEQSPRLRASLQAVLRETPGGHECVSALPSDTAFSGCILCHEFFDALPVHILVWRQGRWLERFVAIEGDRLDWQEAEPSSASLIEQAERRFEPDLPAAEREEGWQAEVSPASAEYAQKLWRALARGELLVIDYGYTLEEWQMGRFRDGSAMGYRQHQAVTDLLAAPGDQDLTAHVNFDIFLDAVRHDQLKPNIRLRAQSRFLMNVGEADEFADVFADCADEQERLKRAQQLKALILPEGMGSTFQVLQLRKGI